jgi:hypothetical protein
LDELLREAQNVYVRHNEEKQKQKPKFMLSTIRQITQKKQPLKILKVGPKGKKVCFGSLWSRTIISYHGPPGLSLSSR